MSSRRWPSTSPRSRCRPTGTYRTRTRILTAGTSEIPSSELSASTEVWRMLWSATPSGGFRPLRDIESALRRTAKTSGADIRGPRKSRSRGQAYSIGFSCSCDRDTTERRRSCWGIPSGPSTCNCPIPMKAVPPMLSSSSIFFAHHAFLRGCIAS
jgi:hypothetical protein